MSGDSIDWFFWTGASLAVESFQVRRILQTSFTRSVKTLIVMILTGARKDERLNRTKHRDDILDTLIKAKAAERILKYEVSRKLDSPDRGLPKLAEKLKELKLEEMLRQRAVDPFPFQTDYRAVTVRGTRYQFNDRQAAMTKLLHDKFLNDKPGLVMKVPLRKQLMPWTKTGARFRRIVRARNL